MVDVVRSLPYPSRTTNVSEALRVAREIMFQPENGDRQGELHTCRKCELLGGVVIGVSAVCRQESLLPRLTNIMMKLVTRSKRLITV